MSIPTSAIAATAAGFSCEAGSEPPEYATARPAARCSNQPSAIWLRPALCTQRNSTAGRRSGPVDIRLHLVRAVVRHDDRVRFDVGIPEPDRRDREETAGELHDDEHRC